LADTETIIVGRLTEAEGEVMFSEPGFWLMIAGSLLVAVAFIGLAFNRMGGDPPAHSANVEEQEPSIELPVPFSTNATTEVAPVFGRGRGK